MRNTTITLTQEECTTQSLPELYDLIATKAGYKDTSKLQYDCTHILVSKGVQKAFYDAYEHGQQNAVAIWAMVGPKASLESEAFIAEIQDGFIIEN